MGLWPNAREAWKEVSTISRFGLISRLKWTLNFETSRTLQILWSHYKICCLITNGHCCITVCSTSGPILWSPPLTKICIPINKICGLPETSDFVVPLQNLLSHNKWPHCLLNFWSYPVPLTKFVFPLTKICIPINKICIPINKICSLTEIQALLMPALKRHDPLWF
jgi:hypothetical protein